MLQAVVRTGDRRGAELPWTLLLDGRKISLEEFRALPVAGKHLVAARVTDSRGRTADSPQLAFTLDGAAPWVDLVALSADAPPDGDYLFPTRRADAGARKVSCRAPTAACDAGLEALEAGGIWKALPCATAVAPAPTTFVVDPARPAVTLRTTAAAVAIGDSVIGAGERLSVAGWGRRLRREPGGAADHAVALQRRADAARGRSHRRRRQPPHPGLARRAALSATRQSPSDPG